MRSIFKSYCQATYMYVYIYILYVCIKMYVYIYIYVYIVVPQMFQGEHTLHKTWQSWKALGSVRRYDSLRCLA